jgi:hypothetical protein
MKVSASVGEMSGGLFFFIDIRIPEKLFSEKGQSILTAILNPTQLCQYHVPQWLIAEHLISKGLEPRLEDDCPCTGIKLYYP